MVSIAYHYLDVILLGFLIFVQGGMLMARCGGHIKLGKWTEWICTITTALYAVGFLYWMLVRFEFITSYDRDKIDMIRAFLIFWTAIYGIALISIFFYEWRTREETQASSKGPEDSSSA